MGFRYVLFNIAVSKTWGFQPQPLPSSCDGECNDCRDPACACAVPKGLCDMLPARMTVDFVRVYQNANDTRYTLGCSPPTRPTKQWIDGHTSRCARRALRPLLLRDRIESDLSFAVVPERSTRRRTDAAAARSLHGHAGSSLPADARVITILGSARRRSFLTTATPYPLARVTASFRIASRLASRYIETLAGETVPLLPIQAGGARCTSDDECGRGHCGSNRGRCKCDAGYVGPRCLAPDGFDDDPAVVPTLNVRPLYVPPTLAIIAAALALGAVVLVAVEYCAKS